MEKNTPHVVIIARLCGLMAARKLARSVRITLIERKNYHTYPASALSGGDAVSLREIAAPSLILRDRPNVQVLLAEVEDFDLFAALGQNSPVKKFRTTI